MIVTVLTLILNSVSFSSIFHQPFDDAMDYLSPPNPDKPDLIIGPEPLSPNASQPPSPSKKKKGGKSVTSK